VFFVFVVGGWGVGSVVFSFIFLVGGFFCGVGFLGVVFVFVVVVVLPFLPPGENSLSPALRLERLLPFCFAAIVDQSFFLANPRVSRSCAPKP